MPQSNLPETSTLWEPSPEKAEHVSVEKINAFLVPGRAFDARGGRLGRGGGHYDRTLSRRARGTWVAGLFFAVQEVELLPLEPHDIPMPFVVTENGWRKTG
jgi:5-formyltetrahydrofolate cyclo-ligase